MFEKSTQGWGPHSPYRDESTTRRAGRRKASRAGASTSRIAPRGSDAAFRARNNAFTARTNPWKGRLKEGKEFEGARCAPAPSGSPFPPPQSRVASVLRPRGRTCRTSFIAEVRPSPSVRISRTRRPSAAGVRGGDQCVRHGSMSSSEDEESELETEAQLECLWLGDGAWWAWRRGRRGTCACVRACMCGEPPCSMLHAIPRDPSRVEVMRQPQCWATQGLGCTAAVGDKSTRPGCVDDVEVARPHHRQITLHGCGDIWQTSWATPSCRVHDGELTEGSAAFALPSPTAPSRTSQVPRGVER
eukprot:365347-Chlamydomonas_euryale.AAC.4